MLFPPRTALSIIGAFVVISIIAVSISTYNYQPSESSRFSLWNDLRPGSLPSPECPPPPPGPPPNKPCNPFLRPGYIDPSTSAWTPILEDTSCPALPTSKLPELVPWLKNKTYYFYGDSVMRNAFADFCGQLGAKVETLPDPPGYLTTSDKQAIHHCHLPQLNFTGVNIYTFGMAEWSARDRPFLEAHASINHRPEDPPHIWTFEDRMRTPSPVLVECFGYADVAVVASGMWDLPYLQRAVTSDFEANGTAQTEAPPQEFLTWYSGRIRDYLKLARELHRPKLARGGLYLATLHDPKKFDMKPTFGMEGYNASNVEFSCLAEPRVRGLREAQIAAAENVDAGEDVGVVVLPYDRWIRTAKPEERMRDDIHPSAFANEFFGMAMTWAARLLEKHN